MPECTQLTLFYDMKQRVETWIILSLICFCDQFFFKEDPREKHHSVTRC